MDCSKSQKRLKACGHALPADHQAAILLLEPGTCALGLASWDDFFDWSAPVVLRLPDPLRDLRPDIPLPELLPQRFRLIALLRRHALEPFARTTPFAGADLHGLKPRHHLGPLVSLGRWGAVGQGHAAPLRETVEQAPFALPPAGDTRAATLPRGNKRHQRRQTPNASSRVPRHSPASALASRPACHRPATAATSDVWHALTPTAARMGHHTSASR